MHLFKRKTISNMSDYLASLPNVETCIDCGANVGVVTTQMAQYAKKVYAFEPNPYAFKELQKKFEDNKKVVIYNQGVWDKNTTTKLFFHENSDQNEVMWSTGSSIIAEKSNVLKSKYQEIEIIDLVEFIKKIKEEITVIKIDIEGAECELLEKIIASGIYKQVKMIFVETHDHKIPSLKDKTNAIRKTIKKNHIKNISLDWI